MCVIDRNWRRGNSEKKRKLIKREVSFVVGVKRVPNLGENGSAFPAALMEGKGRVMSSKSKGAVLDIRIEYRE